MLGAKPCLNLALGVALFGVTAAARANIDSHGQDTLHRPERLTVGTNDQFLGQLSPDEKTLYFVSNSETRKEIYAQSMEQGDAHLVFDEGAEVTWPRVSPDGRTLLYISFREQATGQLCVRELPDGERRCLDGDASTIQAEWIDRKRIILVSRSSIEGNFRVSEVAVGASLGRKTLFEENWTSPAVSPDGRWLIYVPLDRVSERVGPGFAARAGRRLEAVRLDREGPPMPLVLDLPGVSGQPAFARDGLSLYFVQFLSDSNRDGHIDAGDHGMLFRVPFDTRADDAIARAAAALPLQITDSDFNCQYPAPAASRLIVTCSRASELDVFELPLDGEIPEEWSAKRLHSEADLATSHSIQLLLYRHQLEHVAEPSEQRLLLMRLVMTHLDLQEFDAAQFYADKVAAIRNQATRGIARPLQVLIAQRRARMFYERGKAIDRFEEDAKGRLERLEESEKDSPAGRVMKHVVRSEIADSIGDKSRAKLELLHATEDLGNDTPHPAVVAYFERADALYRSLDDREALVALCRGLAGNLGLDPDERLDFARAAARTLVRGLPLDGVDALLARERATEPGDTEYGFALDLARAVLAIRDSKRAQQVTSRLETLFDAHKQPERRRAIIFEAVKAASAAGADSVIEALSERYIDSVQKGTEEYRRASRLYQRAILGHAYRHQAAEQHEEALREFEAVVRRTRSLEAVVAAIDLRLHMGESPEAIEAKLDHGRDRDSAVSCFIRAYLDAHQLPELEGEAHAEAIRRTLEHLRSAWDELRKQGPARALYGAILHEDFLHTGDRASAEQAATHYVIALELVEKDPRYRAMILGQLAMLHTQVGNYRIALTYFEQRHRLPFIGDAEQFAMHLAYAQTLLHVNREKQAAKEAEEALALQQSLPELAPFRALALDRAALYNLAAGQFARALALYDLEVPLLSGDQQAESRRNRIVVRLARAAAALGAGQPRRALEDISSIEAKLDSPEEAASLASPHRPADVALRSVRAIADGLRANAHLALGQAPELNRALELRRETLVRQLAVSDRDEDVRALTLVEAQLAANARDRRDYPAAAKWFGGALERADSVATRSGSEIDIDQLRVLWLGATLKQLDQVPLKVDIPKRLRLVQEKLVKAANPKYRTYQRWFEIYLALSQPSQASTVAAKSK